MRFLFLSSKMLKNVNCFLASTEVSPFLRPLCSSPSGCCAGIRDYVVGSGTLLYAQPSVRAFGRSVAIVLHEVGLDDLKIQSETSNSLFLHLQLSGDVGCVMEIMMHDGFGCDLEL